jgi:hypothetical protein
MTEQRTRLRERARLVCEAMRTAEFAQRLDGLSAGRGALGQRDVNGMVLAALDAMGVKRARVAVRVAWDPGHLRLDLWARPGPKPCRAPGPARRHLQAVG